MTKRYYIFLITGILYLFLLPSFVFLFWILIAVQLLMAPLLTKDWLAAALKDIAIYNCKLTLRLIQSFTKCDKHLMDTPLIEVVLFKSPIDRRRKLLWRGLLMYEYQCILNDDKFGSASTLDDINDYMDMRKIGIQDTSNGQRFLKKEMQLSKWMNDLWDKKLNLDLKYKLLFKYTTPTEGEYARWDVSSIKQVPSEISLQSLPNPLAQTTSLIELDKLFYQFTPKINKQPITPSPIDVRGEIMMQPLQSAESIEEFLEFKPLRKTTSARELKSPQKSCLKESNSSGSSPGDKARRVSFASDSQQSQENSPTHSV
eukprot:NODE_67_length_23829_cov_0.557059.p9 type:complete len:315 gc:universal NODE_67_length_23829_cov_0.557059:20839-19895(-)